MVWEKRFREPKQTRWWIVALSLGLMIGFAIYFSLTIFSQTSLRLDEAQSLFQTNRDIPGVLNLVAQDVHVPGYHILLHFWQLLFGNDIFAARMMSLVFFVALIPAVYALASYTFDRRVGLFAALLVTLSPFMDWYGSEARMYTMLALFTVLHQLAFMKLFKEGKSVHWVWFTLTAIAGMYTHYFFAFVILTEIFFYAMSRKEFAAPKAFRKLLIAGAIVAAALAPWIIYVVQLGTASNTQPSLTEPTSVDLFNTYAQFIFGFQVDGLNTIIVSFWPIVVLLAFFALQANRKTTREVMFFVMAAIIPVLGAFLISVTVRPFFQSRYLIVALPALMIFVAWVLSIYPTKIRRVLQATFIIVMAGLFAVQAINPNTPVKEDYRDAVGYLSEKSTSKDVVVLTAPFTIYPTEYYYTGTSKITTQPIWNRFEQGAVPAFNKDTLADEVRQNTESYQTAWLMVSYDQGYNEDVRDYYDNNFERTSSKEFSKNLWVYSYKISYKPALTIAE